MNTDSLKIKSQPSDEDGGFPALRASVIAHWTAAMEMSTIFVSSATSQIHKAWMDNLPAAYRQHYTCNTCRHFLERFGGLVTVKPDGSVVSVVFPAPQMVPEAFRASVAAIRDLVSSSSIDEAFVTSETGLGTPETGIWTHLALAVPEARRWRERIPTASQRVAIITEEHGMLTRGLVDFSKDTFQRARDLITSDTFYRGQRYVAWVEWLLAQRTMMINITSGARRNALLWKAAAEAPAGWCHVRSGMLGSLLEDIAAGLSVDAIKARWEEKMDPTRYQRAQVDPSAGNIQAAEKLVQELGIKDSLRRRYATQGDIQQWIWRPAGARAAAPPAGGVFGHLTPKAPPPPVPGTILPGQTMTWEKFQRTVLPEARSIEVEIPQTDRFMALVTAADAKAPPILQWDHEDHRNPVSWYYAAGIDAEIKQRVVSAGGQYDNCDIRVSLLWNNRNDLDLHVHTPRKEHIYFGDKRSSCGGWLDVDMNVHGETTKPVENTRWARGTARGGRYQVRVHNYRFHESDGAATPFQVELEAGGTVHSFRGVIPSRSSGMSMDVDVCSFDYQVGKPIANLIRHVEASSASVGGRAGWGLTHGQWVPVTGIVESPNLWGETPQPHHGKHVFFLLDGCKDQQEGVGRGFFAETLRAELRPVRATLEAFTASRPIEQGEVPPACGVGMASEVPWNLRVRVRTATSTATYLIDRRD